MENKELTRAHVEALIAANNMPSGNKYKHDNTLPVDHVFDEDKSVKWNREEVEKHNKEVVRTSAKIEKEKQAAISVAQDNILEAIQNELGVSFTAASKIWWGYLYGEYHSYGYMEMYTHYGDVADLLGYIINEVKNND